MFAAVYSLQSTQLHCSIAYIRLCWLALLMICMCYVAALPGEVDTLLESYDRERDSLPPPTPLLWEWGWTTSAEIWNGRLAMVAILLILAMETQTGQGVLSRVFLSFLPS